MDGDATAPHCRRCGDNKTINITVPLADDIVITDIPCPECTPLQRFNPGAGWPHALVRDDNAPRGVASMPPDCATEAVWPLSFGGSLEWMAFRVDAPAVGVDPSGKDQ